MTSTLPLRVVCRQLPASALAPDGRVIDSICLGVGEPGCDPEIVFTADQEIIVIDTHVDLTIGVGGVLDVVGPYLIGERDAAALLLRWGTVTGGSHFLLFSGAQLRLPRMVTNAAPQRRGGAVPVLTATVALTDACGAPVRGVVDAVDVGWRLTSRNELARTIPTSDASRGSVIASTA